MDLCLFCVLVVQYLSDVGLSESVAVFEAECKLKGETIGSVPCNSGPRNIQVHQRVLVSLCV